LKNGVSSNFILCPAIRPGELTDKVTLQAPTNCFRTAATRRQSREAQNTFVGEL
jgi:hypothetical protein